MADSVTIISDVVNGVTINPNVTPDTNVVTSIAEETNVTSDVVSGNDVNANTSTGGRGEQGEQGEPGVSGASLIVHNEVPGGAVNGVNTVYTTAFAYVVNSTQVSINGLLQRLTVSYNESGSSQITLSEAPHSGDILTISYIKS